MALLKITKGVGIGVACAGVVLLSVVLMKSGRPVINGRIEIAAEPMLEARVVAVHGPEEIVELRDRNTRVYDVTRDVEITDPGTGNVSIEQSGSRIVEKGNNLCHLDESGDFVPSVAEFEALDWGFIGNRNNFTVSSALTLGDGLLVAFDGVPVRMRPSCLMLFDGMSAVTIAEADPSAVGKLDPQDPSVLRFRDAFAGVADLEYVLEKGGYHQNVVLKRAPGVPEGFDPEKTELLVYTEIGYDDLVEGYGATAADTHGLIDISSSRKASEVSGESILFEVPDRFVPSGKRTLFTFGPSFVWGASDGATPDSRFVAGKQLFRDELDRTHLVERLPISLIADMQHPVVLDYVVEAGGIMVDETWVASSTYYLSGPVTVYRTLRIEPGATLKYASTSYLTTGYPDGKIIADGEPYNYVAFTTVNDDSCGEVIPGSSGIPTSNAYSYALKLAANTSAGSVVRYCKIGYAQYGVSDYVTLSSPIENNVFYDCYYYGIYANSVSTDLKNNLFTDPGTVYGYAAGIYLAFVNGATVSNNTINGSKYGIRLLSCSNVDMNYNLFTSNSEYAVYSTSGSSLSLDSNGYYGNGHNNQLSGTFTEQGRVTCSANPYIGDGSTVGTLLGGFYLNSTGFNELKDKGSGEGDTEFPSDVFTVQPPADARVFYCETTMITMTSGDNWTKSPSEDDDLDIGFHGNRVDYILNNTSIRLYHPSEEKTLDISPGVVVAIKGPRCMWMSTNAKLLCEGDPHVEGYNLFTRLEQVSTKMESRVPRVSANGYVYLEEGSSQDSRVTYTRFKRLGTALYVYEELEEAITDCTFELCYEGAVGRLTNGFERNLFSQNETAFYLYNGTHTLARSTFDRNTYGVYYGAGSSLTCENCLFTDNAYGVYLSSGSGDFGHDYNGFYLNDENLYDAGSSSPEAPGTHSILLAGSPYDAAGTLSDRWRLNQAGRAVDGGEQSVENAGLDEFSTALDGRLDVGTEDIGYHYPGPKGISDATVTNHRFDPNASGSAGYCHFTIAFSPAATDWDIDISGPDSYSLHRDKDASDIDFTWYGRSPNQPGGTVLTDGVYTVVITWWSGGIQYTARFIMIVDKTNPTVAVTWPDNNQRMMGL